MLLVVGCDVSTENIDIEATVEARIASIPTPTAQIVIQEVEVIVEVEKEVVKEVEVEVEVIKEIEVEKIVEVVVTATPIPEPTPATMIGVDEWEDLASEYERNAIGAMEKYRSKELSIRGKIHSLDFEWFISGDLPTLTFKSEDDKYFYCGINNPADMQNVSVGQRVIVKGYIIQWDSDVLYAYPCSIVD